MRHHWSRPAAISLSAHWVVDGGHRAVGPQRGTATLCRGRFHRRIFAVPVRLLREWQVCRSSRRMAYPNDDPCLRPRLGRARSRDHQRVLAATQIKRAISCAAALARSSVAAPPGGARRRQSAGQTWQGCSLRARAGCLTAGLVAASAGRTSRRRQGALRADARREPCGGGASALPPA